MKTQSVLPAPFAPRSSPENLNLGSTRPNFTRLLCFKRTVRGQKKKVSQREPWTSVLSARPCSRGRASLHSTCWSIQVWNRTNVTSVKRHLHAKQTYSCTSEPTRERSRTLVLAVEGASLTSPPLGDTAGHTPGNVLTLAACVEVLLRRPAPFTTTRRLAKGKGWTQKTVTLRRWKISAYLIFNQSTRILHVILQSLQIHVYQTKAFSHARYVHFRVDFWSQWLRRRSLKRKSGEGWAAFCWTGIHPIEMLLKIRPIEILLNI